MILLQNLIDQTIGIESVDTPNFSDFKILVKIDDREFSVKEDIKIDFERQVINLEAI